MYVWGVNFVESEAEFIT